MLPPVPNTLSDGALASGMQRYFFAKHPTRGKFSWCTPHHSKGSYLLSASGVETYDACSVSNKSFKGGAAGPVLEELVILGRLPKVFLVGSLFSVLCSAAGTVGQDIAKGADQRTSIFESGSDVILSLF